MIHLPKTLKFRKDRREIIVEVVEVIPYKTYTGKQAFLVGLRIKEGEWVSSVFHIWGESENEIRRKIEEEVDYYLKVRGKVTM